MFLHQQPNSQDNILMTIYKRKPLNETGKNWQAEVKTRQKNND
jgi:hypothetical protein